MLTEVLAAFDFPYTVVIGTTVVYTVCLSYLYMYFVPWNIPTIQDISLYCTKHLGLSSA